MDKRRVLRSNAGSSDSLNASKRQSAPIKVRNLKTGELALYTPDKLQPTIPAGWVPANASRRDATDASSDRSDAFVKDGSLIVQRRGNEYRILNSSRKVVAKGKLNASVGDEEVFREVQYALAEMGYQLEEQDGGDGWVLYDQRGSYLGSWDSDDIAQFFEMAYNFKGDQSDLFLSDAIVTYILDDVVDSSVKTEAGKQTIPNSSRRTAACGGLNSASLDANAGMSGEATNQELEELVRSKNPEILKFYDVLTYPEMASDTGMSVEDLHEDDDKWSSYGGCIIGFVKAKPEYMTAASYDGQDYGEIWENGFVGQAMGGEGSRNGHWATDLNLDIFGIEGYGDTEGDLSWQNID